MRMQNNTYPDRFSNTYFANFMTYYWNTLFPQRIRKKIYRGINCSLYKKYKHKAFYMSMFTIVLSLMLLMILGWLIGGYLGIIIAATLSICGYLISALITPWSLLLNPNIRKFHRIEDVQLWQNYCKIVQRAGIKKIPELYILDSKRLQAFATGIYSRDFIVMSSSMLKTFNKRELLSILAHEISHIKNHDKFILGTLGAISRINSIMSCMGILLTVIALPLYLAGIILISWQTILLFNTAPIISGVLLLALSRIREYNADIDAANLTGDPAGLASALKILYQLEQNYWSRLHDLPKPHPLLKTHPPLSKRIARLENMMLIEEYEVWA